MERIERDVLTTLTTGQAAKICHVSQQTIIRHFDAGAIQGFKMPGSKFRWIPKEALIKFMEENNIPIDESLFPEQVVPKGVSFNKGMRIFVIDWQEKGSLVSEITESLKQYYQLEMPDSVLLAGVKALQFRPHIILLNFSADVFPEILSFCQWVRLSPVLKRTRIIAVVEGSLPSDFPRDKFDICILLTPGDLIKNTVKIMKAIMGFPEESSQIPAKS